MTRPGLPLLAQLLEQLLGAWPLERSSCGPPRVLFTNILWQEAFLRFFWYPFCNGNDRKLLAWFSSAFSAVFVRNPSYHWSLPPMVSKSLFATHLQPPSQNRGNPNANTPPFQLPLLHFATILSTWVISTYILLPMLPSTLPAKPATYQICDCNSLTLINRTQAQYIRLWSLLIAPKSLPFVNSPSGVQTRTDLGMCFSSNNSNGPFSFPARCSSEVGHRLVLDQCFARQSRSWRSWWGSTSSFQRRPCHTSIAPVIFMPFLYKASDASFDPRLCVAPREIDQDRVV